ncbi:MAG: hypothetical protein NVSMB2_12340 [Chloroflexota bacterium]
MIDSWSTVELPFVRLALGLGDQELEQRLRPALDATDDLRVVAQCLAADQVLTAVQAGGIDAVILSWALHRLTDLALDALDRTRVPLVVLAADPEDLRWNGRRATILALDVDIRTIRQAIAAARMGTWPSPRSPVTLAPVPTLKPADRAGSDQSVRIIAVTGGAGSPGRTTVAVNLAASLGAVAPTILVEADLIAPAVAAHLGLDPSRNMCPLAHAVREDSHAWSAALADEIQPLSRASAGADVLCGPPKREMRASVSAAFLQQLLGELSHRYQYVIVDVGSDVLGLDSVAACTRAVLVAADDILLTSRSDVVGLWHAQVAVGHLDHHAGVDLTRVRVVLNQFERRFHHSPDEIAHHLGLPIVAVVPADVRAAEKAKADQQLMVLDTSSRASRALVKLADDVHAHSPTSVSDTDRPRRSPWWRRLVLRSHTPQRRPSAQPKLAREHGDVHVQHQRERAVT